MLVTRRQKLEVIVMIYLCFYLHDFKQSNILQDEGSHLCKGVI